MASCAVVLLLGASFFGERAAAYIHKPMTLGYVIQQSTNIVVMRVEKVEDGDNVLHFRKLRDIKGTHHEDVIVQQIGQQGFHDHEWQTVMRWAKPGKIAVLFHNGRSSETCIDNYWYQCNPRGGNWRMTHAEPYLRRSFAGSTKRLVRIVDAVHAGKEAIAPCYFNGTNEEIEDGTARMQRLKVSLQRIEYDPKRDFVGWGGGELEQLRGMPGFSHLATLADVGLHARGISAGDFDGDGRVDLVLFGERKSVLVRNEEKIFNEIELPYEGGARSAALADFDGDHRLDLLLGTPSGVRLLSSTSDREEPFRDSSDLLPRLRGANVTSAAWIDVNRDGWPDVVVANGFFGISVILNFAGENGARRLELAQTIEIPDPVYSGDLANRRGSTLSVGDVNGDGVTDVFHDAGGGVLLLGRETCADAEGVAGSWFDLETDSGIRLRRSSRGGSFGDFDSDGDLDYFSPSDRFGRLFANDGRGQFHDVTSRAFSIVAANRGFASSSAWGDFDGDGRLDLVVTYRNASHRVFLKRGERFADATHELGLDRRSFQSVGASLADFDGDGDLDLALINEGSDSSLLLAANRNSFAHTPVDVVLPVAPRASGAVVKISEPREGADGFDLVFRTELGGLSGGGSQSVSTAHVGLVPGVYRLEIEYRDGTKQQEDFEVKQTHVVLEVQR